MVPRRSKRRRFGLHVGGFLLGTVLTGILGTVLVGLSIRDSGLIVTAVALTIIFFFEVLYQQNVRLGRIPMDRAEVLRILMLPMVYLAALGLLFPFFETPGFDSTARFHHPGLSGAGSNHLRVGVRAGAKKTTRSHGT